MVRVLLLLWACSPWLAGAQTTLPDCAAAPVAQWDKCIGSHAFKAGKYSGEWLDGKPHGHGEFAYSNGMRYAGGFKEGNRNGQGVTTLPNGDRYEGGYRNGRRDGQGTLYRTNGEVTSGYWLMGKYQGAERPVPVVAPGSRPPSRIAMIQSRGIFQVPATLNGQVTLDFMVDSGAALVTVPEATVSAMLASGTLSDADFKNERNFVIADGSRVKSRTFVIRSLQVGDHTVNNVLASEFAGSGRPLLGQSFLKQLKSWSIDNTTQELVLE